MRTFIENYLHFMKNCIRLPYEKLKSLKSGFIENSNFENNRDPWTLESPFSHPFWNYSIKKWLDMTSPLIYVLKSFLDVFSSTNWLTKFYQKRIPGPDPPPPLPYWGLGPKSYLSFSLFLIANPRCWAWPTLYDGSTNAASSIFSFFANNSPTPAVVLRSSF